MTELSVEEIVAEYVRWSGPDDPMLLLIADWRKRGERIAGLERAPGATKFDGRSAMGGGWVLGTLKMKPWTTAIVEIRDGGAVGGGGRKP